MKRRAWKMSRFFGGNIVWAGLLFLIVGCATNPVAYDLVVYVNQGLLHITELEKRSLAEYNAVVGSNYTTDQKAYEALKDKVIPLYGRFLDELRSINPKEDEVKVLHGRYIREAERIGEGFRKMMMGLKLEDINMQDEANDMIQRGRVEIEQWQKDLYSLCLKYGVAPDKKEKE